MKTINLQTPLTKKIIAGLKAGDKVLISGWVYTARDAAHRKLTELYKKGKKFSFDIKNQIIYYTGPTPAPKEKVIGSAGPTTSARMDPYTIPLLKSGLKAVIGKGERSEETKKEFKKYKSIYFVTIGGAGALLGKCIEKVEVVAYKELGTEAIRKIKLKNFPSIVAYDIYGGDVYEKAKGERQKVKDRRQRTEDRRQRTEDRRQKRQKAKEKREKYRLNKLFSIHLNPKKPIKKNKKKKS
jgi:fumarate hydratase subunit beta